MRDHFRSCVRFSEAEGEGSDNGPLVFVASTGDLARDGDIIEGPWVTEHYTGAVQWAHNSAIPNIGTARVYSEGTDLHAELTLDKGDPFAAEIERKIRSGVIKAVSVSWIPGAMVPLRSLPSDDKRRRDSGFLHRAPELLEISVVNVGSDRKALRIRGDGMVVEEDPSPTDDALADPLDALRAEIASLRERLDAYEASAAERIAQAVADELDLRAAGEEAPEGEDVPEEAPPEVAPEEEPVPRAWRDAGWASEVEREAELAEQWRAAGWP